MYFKDYTPNMLVGLLLTGKVMGFMPYEQGTLTNGHHLREADVRWEELQEQYAKQLPNLPRLLVRDNKTTFCIRVELRFYGFEYVGVQFYDNLVYFSASPPSWRHQK